MKPEISRGESSNSIRNNPHWTALVWKIFVSQVANSEYCMMDDKRYMNIIKTFENWASDHCTPCPCDPGDYGGSTVVLCSFARRGDAAGPVIDDEARLVSLFKRIATKCRIWTTGFVEIWPLVHVRALSLARPRCPLMWRGRERAELEQPASKFEGSDEIKAEGNLKLTRVKNVRNVKCEWNAAINVLQARWSRSERW